MSDTKICRACGKEVNGSANFCPVCGNYLNEDWDENVPESVTEDNHEDAPPQASDNVRDRKDETDNQERLGKIVKELEDDLHWRRIGEIVASIIWIVFVIYLMRQCTGCAEHVAETVTPSRQTIEKVDNFFKETQALKSDLDNLFGTSSSTPSAPPKDIKPSAPNYKNIKAAKYVNGDYAITAPDFFVLDTDMDNMYFTSPDGAMSLTVYKQYNGLDSATKEVYDSVLSIAYERNDSLTYKRCLSEGFYISGFLKNGTAYYRHAVLHNNYIYTYIFEWQQSVYEHGVDIINAKIIKFEFENEL